MSYRLLALDMDGTLLTSDKQVSERTHTALECLAERGVPIAFCTGRCFVELQDWSARLHFIQYGVLASGAVVYDFHEQRALNVTCMDTNTLLSAMVIAKKERPMVHVLSTNASVARPSDVQDMDRFGMGVYQPMFEKIATLKDDLGLWVTEHEGEVVKLNFYHTDAAARDRSRERLERAGLALTLANAESSSVECSACGVSKGQGIAELVRHLGITTEDVVAIGDSDNDSAALSVVGMPVAMGNGSRAIRRMAKLIVADNDHDGIAEAVARLF